MRHVVALLAIAMASSMALAQKEGTPDQPQEEQKAPTNMEEYLANILTQMECIKKDWGPSPTTLAEAHVRLEQVLSPESLAKIDAMDSEDGMTLCHHGLGMTMRNAWGLWRRSALAQHMRELGFDHPDSMSSVILNTFWCKRHGKDFRLEERAARYRKFREEEENRIPRARAALREKMMGLRFEKREVPKVPIVVRNEKGLRVRFVCRFRDGAFLTAYHRGRRPTMPILMQESYTDPNGDGRPTSQYDDFVHRGYYFSGTDRRARRMEPGEDAYTPGYYFDPADSKIHPVCVPEVNEVYSAVVAGERAWFGGLTDGKLVVTGVGEQERVTVPLPQTDEMPDLGVDGKSLLAVYTKTIYRLEDRNWTVVHSGDILLPRSGLPPLRQGNTVFFRDEGDMGGRTINRLWWLTMAEPLHLSVLDRHLRVMTAGMLRLREVTSCSLTDQGDLWVCTGRHHLANCLLRRSMDASWSIATVSSSVQLAEGWPDVRQKYQGAALSAVRALRDDSLLLAGRTGLYRLQGSELIQEMAFTLDRPSKWVKAPDRVVPHVRWRRENGKMVKEVTEVVQKAPEKGRQVVSSVPWTPNNILGLDDGSYLVTTDRWEGAYRLGQGDDGRWTCLPADEGDPVVW